MKQSTTRKIFAIIVLLIGGYLFHTNVTADNIPNRVYELRTYTATEGSLDNLHARFRDHTNTLFIKHGIQIVGYWTPMDKPESSNTLIYLISHASREAAAKSWQAFAEDPEWKKVSEASTANGPILAKVASQYLNATDYSPLK